MARFLAVPLAVAALALAGCGSSRHAASTPAAGTTAAGTTVSGTTTATASSAGATPRCTSSALAVWIGIGEGGGAAGSTYYPIELTNISGHSCHLAGFPGVSAWSGRQLGSPAARDHSRPAQTVSLARGDTAHVLLRITDVANLPAGTCKPVAASGLKVYPPDERSARGIPFNFEACSKAGPVFLSVRPVEPGVGVPGFSS